MYREIVSWSWMKRRLSTPINYQPADQGSQVEQTLAADYLYKA